MFIESANIPLPSEIILPFGGFLVSQGELKFFWAAMAGNIGGTLGSIFSYALGLWGGRPLLVRYGRWIGITTRKLEMAEYWFARYGEVTVFFTRLMPVARTFISFPAGISRMHFGRFVVYTFLGSLPWSFFLTYLGVKLGENWTILRSWFHRLDVVITTFLVLGVLFWCFKRFLR
ncbi:MAG: DedA family protein [Peptococcaceae bacterium]|nr:DedA family protein [Peptococcaceae bacterium]